MDLEYIQEMSELESLYGEVSEGARRKGSPILTPLYAKWIEASKFCVLSTVGKSGTDASPRGDIVPVVSIIDEKTMHMPDWRGNNRIDSLRNIVEDGHLTLTFFLKKFGWSAKRRRYLSVWPASINSLSMVGIGKSAIAASNA